MVAAALVSLEQWAECEECEKREKRQREQVKLEKNGINAKKVRGRRQRERLITKL